MKKQIFMALIILTFSVGSYACHMCYSPTSILNSNKQHVCAGCLTCYYAKHNPYLKAAQMKDQNYAEFNTFSEIPSDLSELKIN